MTEKGPKTLIKLQGHFYTHTTRFCVIGVIQENIEHEVLKVQTELARSVQ